MIIYGFATYSRLTIGNYVYPIWAEVIGNLMNVAIVSGIIFYAVYSVVDVIRNKKVKFWEILVIKYFIDDLFTNKKPWNTLRKPTHKWIPLRLKDRVFANVIKFEERYIIKDNPSIPSIEYNEEETVCLFSFLF